MQQHMVIMPDDDQDMCNCVNEQLLSVFTTANLEYIPEPEVCVRQFQKQSQSKNIVSEDVAEELYNLKAHKSPELDEDMLDSKANV